MKYQSMKRIVAVCLAIMMLVTAISIMIIPSHAVDVNVQTSTGKVSPEKVTDYYAYRASVGGEFTAFSYKISTWGMNGSATLSLYKWTGDPEASMKRDPIATKHFDKLEHKGIHTVTFDPQPVGEYLFVIHNVEGAAGVYAIENCRNSLGFVYVKAGNYTQGGEQPAEPDLTVTFTSDVETPFLQCETMYGNYTAPEEYVIPDDSLIKTHEVMPDTWVFTDGLGRVSLTNADVGDPRDDKTLAMFYWTWHIGRPEVKNINNLTEQYPEASHNYTHSIWGNGNFQGSWNESIYGYYESTDTWVSRRHAELLANAGVDVVFADNTNATITHRDGYQTLFQTWSAAMDDGVLTPKVSFLLPFSAGSDTVSQVKDIYNDVYRAGDYHNLWFYWEDKPLLMGYGESLNQNNVTEKEMANFFTWRPGMPSYNVTKKQVGNWGWLSVYPQAVHYADERDKRAGVAEQMTVGVAVNHNYELNILTGMNGNNVIGRSYTSDFKDRYQVDGKEASKWGYNFAEQFTYALEVDPKVIFVTGWNEWAMARMQSYNESASSVVTNVFFDQYNNEFSRDLEPTKGELKDHYYYQLVNFVRQYKGVRPIPTPSMQATVDITADNTQWSSVEPYYAAYIGNTHDREGEGWGNLTYSEYSGRNDIIGAKVARDADNVYFYVECNEDITPYTDPLWMVLYIDADQENQGWETFDFVLNKTSPTATKAVLEKFTGNGYETETVGEVDYTVCGKYMQVKVPKSMLDLRGYDFTINFTWTDNVHDEADKGAYGDENYKYTRFSGDIMDFYISGDVAPAGRFKYSFISTHENATGEPAPETQPQEETTPEEATGSTTDMPLGDVTNSDTTSTTDATQTNDGCTSVVGYGITMMISAMAAAVVLSKKKH